ncbi:hypothetical protein HNY73_002318 [Argiope bruennichi]|uniref:DUF4806 domain-containing protein n=1 Tax=Argiope bruennichi TaxID=94029 RepID=A0A8T0FT44_ARGBR|nr:hypothetical protein HNY73_002318 [Argiope bruennichi]
MGFTKLELRFCSHEVALSCTYFGSFGGHTYSSLVRRILQTVMTNELNLQYNWKGTGGIKLAFQNIIQMISASVRKHKKFENVSQHEVEVTIKKWLVHAKDRDGGRAHRARSNKQHSTAHK